jgi:hypothetical protein
VPAQCAKRTRRSRLPAYSCPATHSAVSPRAADGSTARMICKPNRATLTSDAALLPLQGIGLSLRRALSRRAAAGRTTALPG